MGFTASDTHRQVSTASCERVPGTSARFGPTPAVAAVSVALKGVELPGRVTLR